LKKKNRTWKTATDAKKELYSNARDVVACGVRLAMKKSANQVYLQANVGHVKA